MECDDGALPAQAPGPQEALPHPSPVSGPRKAALENMWVDTEGASCPSGMRLSPRWVASFGSEAGGRQGSLRAVGVGLHHLAVHGHSEGQAQDLRGHGGLG